MSLTTEDGSELLPIAPGDPDQELRKFALVQARLAKPQDTSILFQAELYYKFIKGAAT